MGVCPIKVHRAIELLAISASKPTCVLFHQLGKPPAGTGHVGQIHGSPERCAVRAGSTIDRERRLWAKDEILASPYLRAANSSIVRRGP